MICENCRELRHLGGGLITGSYVMLYRCPGRKNQKRHYSFGSRIPPTDVVHLIYLLMLDISYNQINHF